jgi:DNA invertase Pin-like site-specific DNA recombinase
MKDHQRFTLSHQNAEGRLKYKNLVKKTEIIKVKKLSPYPANLPPADHSRKQILQLKDDEVIGIYNNIQEAANAVGVTHSTIWKVLRGLKKSSKGYQWKYA